MATLDERVKTQLGSMLIQIMALQLEKEQLESVVAEQQKAIEKRKPRV